jgi:hypothetical protein
VARNIDVLIEQGSRRTFASALDWPGWARSDRDPDRALDALDAYRDRYAGVLAAAGLAAPVGRLRVAETVPGDAGTDFGAPSRLAVADERPLRAADRVRLCAMLGAAWSAFDVVTSRRLVLRSGPRGGGRSIDQLRRHVTDAEVAYARGLGLRVSATDGDPAKVRALRDEVCAVLRGELEPARPPRWPLRYATRRIAWHVLDHAFEAEDRSSR